MAVVLDITRRKQIEAALEERTRELQRSNAELEQFASTASHDLREPLRMVTNYTELIARRYAGQLDEKGDRFIRYALEGAQRMEQLIQDLLSYARAGAQLRKPEPISCEVVLEQVLRALHPVLEEASARVEHAELPTVLGDAGQLRQLFQNLVGNAVKFRSERAPEVRVRADRVDDGWRVSVEDNGIGIEAGDAEQVFQMFRRLHPRERFEGSGMGLAICKRIVEGHRGRIWIEAAEGGGTAVRFTLPAVPE